MGGVEPPVLVLTGTTASGKDRVGTELAAALGGEVVSLDSMKVYRRMDAGTDKPAPALRDRVPHHLLDVLEPSEEMNLRRFVEMAHAAVREIRGRGRLPVAVGGTALYLTGFLKGVAAGVGAAPGIRRRLREEAGREGVPALHARLRRLDPVAASRIHPNDYRRIERALEVHATTGRPLSAQQVPWSGPDLLPHVLVVLTWPRDILDRRIDRRVEAMFAGGLVEEVRRVLEEGPGFGPTASQALGYRQVLAHLAGEMDLPDTVERVKVETRRFARRQLTWFRRMPGARYLLARPDQETGELVEEVLEEYRSGGRLPGEPPTGM